MRPLIIVILLIWLTHAGYGQTFLDAYKKYRLEQTDKLANSKTNKEIKNFIKSQIIELDTVFQSYKTKTNFDFNIADTLFLIYDSPAESPFTSDIIIWSGKDTISYKQGFQTIEAGKNRRTVSYESFLPNADKSKYFKLVTERDSLMTLVSRRDFITISHLGDNQSISDGSYVSIYVAYKDGGQYKFETCFPKQFVIRDVYRKE